MDEEHGSIINIDWVSEGFWNRLKFHEYILFFFSFSFKNRCVELCTCMHGARKKGCIGWAAHGMH
jgi:hypothetical protein